MVQEQTAPVTERNFFMQQSFRQFFILLSIALLFSSLFGCNGGSSGGSSGTNPPASGQQMLSGTAASGAAIIGTVTIKDSSVPPQVKTEKIKADGAYQIDVTGMTPPFLLKADGTVGGRGARYHSAATAGDINGTINITPFTDLILSNVARQLAENLFDNYNPEKDKTEISKDNLNAQIAQLQHKLRPILESAGLDASIDLLRGSFTPNHKGLDAVLDAIEVVPPGQGQKIFTLINRMTKEKIQDDIGGEEPSSTIFPPPPPGQGPNAAGEILLGARQLLDSLNKIFKNGLPKEDDPALLALLGDDLMDDGRDKEKFASDWAQQPMLIGMKASSSRLVKWNPETKIATIMMDVTLTNGMIFTFDNRIKKSGTIWQNLGNGRILEVEIETKAVWDQVSNRSESGLDLGFWDREGVARDRKLAYILFTGPGIPELRLERCTQDQMGFCVVGMPAAFYQNRMDSFIFREVDGLDITEMEKHAVLRYTAKLYTENAVLMDTYEMGVSKAPVRLADIQKNAEKYFAKITKPSLGDLENYTGGNTEVSWTKPEAPTNRFTVDLCWYYTGGNDSIDADVSGEKTSAVLPVEENPNISRVWIEVEYMDAFFREFETRLDTQR